MDEKTRPVLVFADGQKTNVKGEAKFHQFGVDFIEFSEGPANYSVAIVEWPDGGIDTVAPSQLQFLDKEVKHAD